MPQLTRDPPKLLRRVQQKPHATQDDHADPLPTATGVSSKDEDVYADPESSGDDKTTLNSQPTFVPFRRIDGVENKRPSLPSFRQARSSLSLSSGKETGRHGTEHASSDDDVQVFSSQGSNKRRNTSSPLQNIHAVGRKRERGYGRRQKQQTDNKTLKPSSKANGKPQEDAPAPKFQAARTIGMFEFGSTAVDPQFHTARLSEGINVNRDSSLPSSLSSPSSPRSPEVDEIQGSSLPPSQPDASRIECAICGEQVELSLKQDFEDQFNGGEVVLSYKWQRRFCRHHKKQEAKQLRELRSYPEIDWTSLETRMRRHHSHLEDVMSRAKPSHYRDMLSEKLENGGLKTMKQIYNTNGSKRACVGYYGPRGEKVMTEHIVAHLSGNLREQAVRDRLIAAAGVSGGVSGFVQAVLVPELAEQLIREDMKVPGERATEIIVESAELGDLLYPDIDDEIVNIDDARD